MDDELGTAAQDEWVAIVDRTRLELSNRSTDLKELSMSDLQIFIVACRDALQNEIMSSSLDKRVDKAKSGFDTL